jgi:hypothetical protein
MAKQNKTDWATRRRVCFKNSLVADTSTKKHSPTIFRPDSRYDFLEKSDSVGSISLFFRINSFAYGSGQAYFKLIGSASDDGGVNENGWMVYINKATTSPAIVFFNGRTGGGDYANQKGMSYQIKADVWYHLVVNKNGVNVEFYLNGILQTTTNSWSSTREATAKLPITLVQGRLDNQDSRAVVSYAHVVFLNRTITETEAKAIHKLSGKLPASTHANVVGHWPLQEPIGSFSFDAVEDYNYAKTRSPEIIRDPFFQNSTAAYWSATTSEFGSSVFVSGGGVRFTVTSGSGSNYNDLHYFLAEQGGIDSLKYGNSYEVTIDCVFETGNPAGLIIWYDLNLNAHQYNFGNGKTTFRIDGGVSHRFQMWNNAVGTMLVKSFSVKQIQGAVQMGSDFMQYGGWNVVTANKGLGVFYWQMYEVGAYAEKSFNIFAPSIIRLGVYRINEGITWKLELFNDATGALVSTQTFTETTSGYREGVNIDLKVDTGRWRVKITTVSFTSTGTSGFNPFFLHRTDEVIPVGYKANPIQLIGYQGSTNIFNLADVVLGSTWHWDSATGTLSQDIINAANGNQGVYVTSIGLIEQLEAGTEYCLRFTCTNPNGATIIFLEGNGAYDSTAGTLLGDNTWYFRASRGITNRVIFMNLSDSTSGFSASNFRLEKLPRTERIDVYSKKSAVPKLRFNDPSKYLQFPANVTGDINPANRGFLTFIFDFSAQKVIQGSYLCVSNAFSVWVGDLSVIGLSATTNDLGVVASLYNSGNGSVSRVVYSFGVGTALKNTRVIAAWDNTSNLKAIKLGINGVVVGTSTAPTYTSVPVEDFGQLATMFKVGAGDQIEVAYAKIFGQPFTDSDIALYGKYGFTNYDSGIEQYTRKATMYPAQFHGNKLTIADSAEGTLVGLTQAELMNSVVAPDGYLPILRNALQLPNATPFNLPNSFSGVSSTNFAIYLTFYINDSELSNQAYILQCGNSVIQLATGSVYGNFAIVLSQPGQYLIGQESNSTSPRLRLKKGINSVCIQKVGVRDFRISLNGMLINLVEAQTGFINKPYQNLNDDVVLTGITSHFFQGQGNALINFGVYNSNFTAKDLLEMHGNSMFNNPADVSRWKGYFQFNDASKATFPDLSGQLSAITNPYSGNYVNPAHADYAIKELQYLRSPATYAASKMGVAYWKKVYQSVISGSNNKIQDWDYLLKCYELVELAGDNLEAWMSIPAGVSIATSNGRITNTYGLIGGDTVTTGTANPIVDAPSGRIAITQTNGNFLLYTAISAGTQKYVVTVHRFPDASAYDATIWQFGDAFGADGGYDLLYTGSQRLGFNDLNGSHQSAAVSYATMHDKPVLTESLIFQDRLGANRLFVNGAEQTLNGPMAVNKSIPARIRFGNGVAASNNYFMEGLVFKTEPSQAVKDKMRELFKSYYKIS